MSGIEPTTAVVLTGVTVVLGEWAGGHGIRMRTVVGGTFLAVSLSVLGEVSPDLAGKFGALVLTVAAFTYGPSIASKLGLLPPGVKPPKWA